MRRYEWLMAAAMLPAIAWLFQLHGPAQWPVWLSGLGALTLVLVVLHLWREGAHWQMGPAYGAAALVLGLEVARPETIWVRMTCAAVALLLLLASAAASYALPMFQLPKPTGKYPVGTRMMYVTDPSRDEMHAWAYPGKREMVVQLWYPAARATGPKAKYRRKKETTSRSSYQRVLETHSIQDAAMAEGRFPVIVHNPAWHGARQRSSFMTQEIASHGYVVAAISHPYNSSFVELADGRVAQPDYTQDVGFSTQVYIPLARRMELTEEEVVIQTRDCRVVLDELEKRDRTPGDALEGHLQMDNVGSYGHSFGGAVCAELAKEDARVRCVLELDGVMHGEVAKSGLDKPLMLIDSPWMADPHAEKDVWAGDVGPTDIPWRVKASEETTQMWSDIAAVKAEVLERCGGFRAVLKGTGHADFTDQIFMSPMRRFSQAGSVKPKRVAEIVSAYMLAFFEQTLRGVPSALLTGESQPFPEMTVEVWKGSEAAIQDGID